MNTIIDVEKSNGNKKIKNKKEITPHLTPTTDYNEQAKDKKFYSFAIFICEVFYYYYYFYTHPLPTLNITKQ